MINALKLREYICGLIMMFTLCNYVLVVSVVKNIYIFLKIQTAFSAKLLF